MLAVKEKIERLLKRRLLTKYGKNDRGKQKVEDRSLPTAEVINIIIGGVVSDDDSNLAKKSYIRFVGVCSI